MTSRVFSTIEALQMVDKRISSQVTCKVDQEPYLLSFVEHLPLPCWVKDSNHIIRYLNKSYLDLFNLTKQDYKCKLDTDLWSEKLATQFKKEDELVLQGGLTIYDIESGAIEGVEPIISGSVTIIKYPLYSGPVVIGIAGLIIGTTGNNV